MDREKFSADVTEFITNHPNIEVIHEEVTEISQAPTIIASGPLTSDALSTKIKELLGEEYFYFFDAAAPIVEKIVLILILLIINQDMTKEKMNI